MNVLSLLMDIFVRVILGSSSTKKSSNGSLSLLSKKSLHVFFLLRSGGWSSHGSPPPPLVSILANLFMGHQWLEQYRYSEVLFYRRYVDDTFCLFHSENDATVYFNSINKINNTVPHQTLTTVYLKTTFTGLLTS